MDIVDFFDVKNDAHLRAYQGLIKTGVFEGREDIFKDITFSNCWQIGLAMKLAQAYVNERFVEVKNITEEEWLSAIGDRDSEDMYSLDDSDLGVCCADISEIRDILLNCKKNHGLTRLEIDRLQLLCHHEHEVRDGALQKILDILGVKWIDN